MTRRSGRLVSWRMRARPARRRGRARPRAASTAGSPPPRPRRQRQYVAGTPPSAPWSRGPSFPPGAPRRRPSSTPGGCAATRTSATGCAPMASALNTASPASRHLQEPGPGAWRRSGATPVSTVSGAPVAARVATAPDRVPQAPASRPVTGLASASTVQAHGEPGSSSHPAASSAADRDGDDAAAQIVGELPARRAGRASLRAGPARSGRAARASAAAASRLGSSGWAQRADQVVRRVVLVHGDVADESGASLRCPRTCRGSAACSPAPGHQAALEGVHVVDALAHVDALAEAGPGTVRHGACCRGRRSESPAIARVKAGAAGADRVGLSARLQHRVAGDDPPRSSNRARLSGWASVPTAVRRRPAGERCRRRG